MAIKQSGPISISDLSVGLELSPTSTLSLNYMHANVPQCLFDGTYPPNPTIESSLSNYLYKFTSSQQGSKLVGSGYIAPNVYMGVSVALSADGNTLAFGGYGDNTATGAVWIFTRANGVWTQQGSKLVGSGSIGSPVEMGTSVSLSADGNTLAFGAFGDNSNIGAVWVFTRANGVWTQQGSKLVGSGYIAPNVYMGGSVSLSADGNTLAFGAYGDNNSIGSVWVFTRANGVWTQQGSKLVGSGYTGNSAQMGTSVSLSADGNTLAFGGNIDNSNIGAVWVFTRANGVWTQQGSKLVGSGYTGTRTLMGTSVSLSADGNTLAFGAYGDNSNIGAVWVFTRANGVWTQQGSKLVGSGYIGTTVYMGISVSLSADGNTLAFGGSGDNNSIGSVWVFTRANGVWTQQGSKLVGSGYTGNYIQMGNIVSLSADGNTLAFGAYGDNSNIGAVWVFI